MLFYLVVGFAVVLEILSSLSLFFILENNSSISIIITMIIIRYCLRHIFHVVEYSYIKYIDDVESKTWQEYDNQYDNMIYPYFQLSDIITVFVTMLMITDAITIITLLVSISIIKVVLSNMIVNISVKLKLVKNDKMSSLQEYMDIHIICVKQYIKLAVVILFVSHIPMVLYIILSNTIQASEIVLIEGIMASLLIYIKDNVDITINDLFKKEQKRIYCATDFFSVKEIE